jgi:hypothetical protein
MKALRIQVERVVRPIRASYLRKDRMREELLTHLTRLFEEELSRTGDAQSATAEATRRFGDAPTLARELQASVPWLERWAFVNLGGPIRRRKGESQLGYILRTNCWGMALGTAAVLLLVLAGAAIGSRRPHRADQPTGSQVIMFVAFAVGIQYAAILAIALLSEGIRQELERRAAAAAVVERRKATWRIVGYVAAASALLGAASAGLMLSIEAFLPISFITRAGFWWVTLGSIALGVPFTLLQGWGWRASTRRFENWDSLDLDEQRAA